MEYQVLSRKYRPQNFNEIIGQPHVVNTLVNSIDLNRIAHGYLFSGLRGVGKTTAARVFAKTLNCIDKKDNITCEKCQNCIEIKESRSLDVIELDGASNRGIDEIREIKETVKYPPVSSKYKIFIIDEVHMLTKEAFNALLKTLEEPPENVIFILATTNPFKIPDTILSRTLRFDFKKISKTDILNHLINLLDKEKIKYEKPALEAISLKADGSMRDGLSILDKIISYSHSMVSYELVKDSLGIIEDEVYLNLLNYVYLKQIEPLLIEVKEIINSGYEISNFISGFTLFLSNCLIYTSGYKNNDIVNDAVSSWLDKNKDNVINVDIMRIIDEIQKYELRSKHLLRPDIALESLLVKIASMDQTVQISQLLSKVSDKNIKPEPIKEDKVGAKIASKESVKADAPIISEGSTLAPIKKSMKDSPKETPKKEQKISIIDPVKNWNDILDLIKSKSERVYGLLSHAKLKADNDILIIDLGDEGNDFIQKSLTNKMELIKDSIFDVTNNKSKIDIIYNKEKNDNNSEVKHPLLDKIKDKFDGDTIR